MSGADQDSGFTIIPNRLFALGNAHAIAVYAAIARHKSGEGIAFPSHQRLCHLTGLGRTTVIETVKILVEADFLQKVHRASGGMKRSNEYRLRPHDYKTRSNANVQMSATRTSMFATRTQDVQQADIRCSPHGHELEPIELDSIELEPATQATPYGLLQVMCETLGQEVSVLGKSEKSKQLAVAKRLVEAGVTSEDVSAITKWLQSQTWMTSGIDFFTIESRLTKWRLAGKPTTSNVTKVAAPAVDGFDPLRTMPKDDQAQYLRDLEESKARTERLAS